MLAGLCLFLVSSAIFRFKVEIYQVNNTLHRSSCKLLECLQITCRSSSQVLLNCKDSNGNPYLQGARKVIQSMHELWKQKNLCEVTLECKDGVMYAHKLVMAAYSDSLCKRFADYPLSQAITISLREYSSAVVCILLEFMYTIELKLTYTNVGELLSLAKELGVIHVVNCCLSFLR